jgi:tetratricopeptide (TPR) repeat protein
MMSIPENADRVRTFIEEITLPTYVLQGENPNPVFHSQYGVAHIYPYTLQDEIASIATEKTYRTLILENKYLRLMVLPELGGRVYSVYDKVSQREVFYKNNVIKFSPLAIRGAFFSGGVEFSFPVAHAPTTADPVNWDIQQESDGSASIIIGGLEHISGMRWTIKLSLYPDCCALAQDVRLFNPTPIPGRYHYWTNASLDSDDQTEFIYPLQRVRSYEFAGTAAWPIARLDLIKGKPGLPGMEGVPMWPAERLHAPLNFRWEKDMLAQVSIFGRQVTWDYFGAWQHSSNTGYAHFARYQDVSGMKLWSWGRSQVGIVNQSALMDDGSLYAETQCGAMETQLDFDFLPPGKTRTWREWWLPLRDLGGLTCASAQASARLHLTQGEDDTYAHLILGVCPVYPLETARIALSIPGQMLFEEVTSISPERAWLKTIPVAASTLGAQPITLIVTDGNGEEILKYTHHREPASIDLSEPPAEVATNTAQDFYQIGLKHENFDNRSQALQSYQQALSLDEQHAPSHFQLGLMLLRSADFRKARDHLLRAASLGIASASYYLGLISWYGGDFEAAEVHYRSVPEHNSMWISAQRGLACAALQRKDWDHAVELLSKIEAEKGDQASLAGLLALAICRSGQTHAAIHQFEQVLSQDPLNLLVLWELSKLEAEQQELYAPKLQRHLADDRQYALDLVAFYLDLGLPADALSILESVVAEWEYPLVYYLGAYIYHLLDMPDKADQWREKGQQGSPDRVFPSRLWEIIALEHALDQSVPDDKAKYYLGNFLYAHQRYPEAIHLWEQAREGLAAFDGIHRNLGLAYWQQKDDPLSAIQEFEKALSLNPNNQDLYLHLDDLYRQMDWGAKRADLLISMLALDPIREDLRKRTLTMMVDLGNYEGALRRLNGEQFVPLEMDQSFHFIYVRALLQKAEAHLIVNQVEEAITDYKKALEFPPNQGVGQPTTMGNAEIHYRLGCAYEQLGKYKQAILSWQEAAEEHHDFGDELYPYIQKSLDKLGRYSELGFHSPTKDNH